MKGYPSLAIGMCCFFIVLEISLDQKQEKGMAEGHAFGVELSVLRKDTGKYYFFGALGMAMVPVRIISLIPMGRRMSITALILDSDPVISMA